MGEQGKGKEEGEGHWINSCSLLRHCLYSVVLQVCLQVCFQSQGSNEMTGVYMVMMTFCMC